MAANDDLLVDVHDDWTQVVGLIISRLTGGVNHEKSPGYHSGAFAQNQLGTRGLRNHINRELAQSNCQVYFLVSGTQRAAKSNCSG